MKWLYFNLVFRRSSTIMWRHLERRWFVQSSGLGMSWTLNVNLGSPIAKASSLCYKPNHKSTYFHLSWISSPALSFYVVFVLPHHHHVISYASISLFSSSIFFQNLHEYSSSQSTTSSFIIYMCSFVSSLFQFHWVPSVSSLFQMFRCPRLCATGVNKASTATEGPTLFRCSRSKDWNLSTFKRLNQVTKYD